MPGIGVLDGEIYRMVSKDQIIEDGLLIDLRHSVSSSIL